MKHFITVYIFIIQTKIARSYQKRRAKMVKTKRLSPVTILNPKVAGVVDAPEVAANDVK